MNDRYLYKAKRKHDSKFFKKGEWVDGAYYIEPYTDKCFIIQWNSTGLGFNEFIEVDGESVCQCTGLKDKNGNKIWENDILFDDDVCSLVRWDNETARFVIDDYGTKGCIMEYGYDEDAGEYGIIDTNGFDDFCDDAHMIFNVIGNLF